MFLSFSFVFASMCKTSVCRNGENSFFFSRYICISSKYSKTFINIKKDDVTGVY